MVRAIPSISVSQPAPDTAFCQQKGQPALPALAQKADVLLSTLATDSDEWEYLGAAQTSAVLAGIGDERGPVESSSPGLLPPAHSPVMCPVGMDGSRALRLQEFPLKQYPWAKRFNSWEASFLPPLPAVVPCVIPALSFLYACSDPSPHYILPLS